jgi:hypothetical protein
MKRISQVSVLLATLLASACGTGVPNGRHPQQNFVSSPAPAAPDYSLPEAWLAFPGRGGLERSTPKGEVAIDENAALADVFFIHPTTYLKNDVWNVSINAPTTYGADVLLNQGSVFNGCCRIYAPHYRQATLTALGASRPAVELAYSDVERAFRWYIEHENHGRPFIIASHSQGTSHALRLLQDVIAGTALQHRLVAAYAIGGYVPSDIGALGVPACTERSQTGCIVSWNSSEAGRTGVYRITRNSTYWWRGAWKLSNQPLALCVNPLSWQLEGPAAATLNPGSEPMPPTGQSETQKVRTLPALNPGVAGAECKADLLETHVGLLDWDYHGALSILYGSYHLVDYGLYYESIRRNAVDRVLAWQKAAGQASEH